VAAGPLLASALTASTDVAWAREQLLGAAKLLAHALRSRTAGADLAGKLLLGVDDHGVDGAGR
jgi:hypothetical protein